jgi:uncharacterized protein with HEPN domain
VNHVKTIGHLQQMLESVRTALSYVEGYSRADFLADKRTQQATVLNLLVIGELASKILSDDAAFTVQHAQVPWRSMVGMRNRIAHGYFEIDLDVVWQTIESALPELLKALEAIDGTMLNP